MDSESEFYSVIEYAVDGPETQQRLIDAFVDVQRQWVAHYPGYLGARLLASLDGERVYNVIRWARESDYRFFEARSDTAGRMAAIERAVDGVRGRAESIMRGDPRYRLAAEVAPGVVEEADAPA